MLSPPRTMVLIHFQVGLSLYVVPKWPLQEFDGRVTTSASFWR